MESVSIDLNVRLDASESLAVELFLLHLLLFPRHCSLAPLA